MRSVLFAVCVALALCPHGASAQERRPTIRPSNVLDRVKSYKARHPRLPPAALARYANALLARRGFDYDFDVCAIFLTPEMAAASRPGTLGTLKFFYRMVTLDDRGLMFKVFTDDRGGPCAECFLKVPSLRVTKTELRVVADGRVYELKRPKSFKLDEAQLVGPDLKTVLRTWQLPYQTIPVGVSPDGRRLYVDFYDDANLGGLVLEVSEDGRPSFRVKREVEADGGEWVEDHPKDASDADLSFKRFRAGRRTHVVRFSGPCT
ncbi:MAG: hypothetical protein JOZ96_16120 [Acidobacteria bacterium]|nr:hypothetical protein [Acidobacteriota bacterium]